MATRLWPLVALLVGAVACDGKDTDGEDEPDPQVKGLVEMADSDVAFPGAHTAEFVVHKAFGFATNGTGVIYMSPNADATCDLVFEYLTEKQFDPASVLHEGRCSSSIRFSYTGDSFDGLTFSDAELGPLVSVNCAMGEGSWELQGSGRDRDYFYSGPWWQGSAKDFTVKVTGADQVPQINVDFGPNFHGQLIYGDADVDPATGRLSGDIAVERCQQLVQTPLWGG